MKRVILALVAFLGLALPSFGSDYVFRDGYWWFAGKAYTRIYYQLPGTWSCGRYYPGAFVYRYDQVDVEKPAAKLSYLDPNWRTEMLKITAQRVEQAAFMESAKALGLVMPPLLAEYGGAYSVPAVQGNTQYGLTSFNLLQQFLQSDHDLEFMAQSSRQQEASQASADKGREGHQLLIGQRFAAKERIAAILAKAAASKEILQAIEGTGTRIETKQYQFNVAPQPGGGLKVERQDGAVPQATKEALAKQWAALAADKCASCHTGEQAKGGFRIGSYPQLSQADKLRVWERLTTPDDNKVMPRTAEGRAGKKLTAQELQLFIVN